MYLISITKIVAPTALPPNDKKLSGPGAQGRRGLANRDAHARLAAAHG